MNAEEFDAEFVPEPENEAAEIKDRSSSLKQRLEQCLAEKQEYLDGWQRAKADLINYKKRTLEDSERVANGQLDSFLQGLLPVLDSFEAGMASEAAESTSTVEGMKQIHRQLLAILAKSGVEAYGSEGEPFTPELYEPVGQVEGEESDVIAKVLQKGYRRKGSIIRIAKVIITS